MGHVSFAFLQDMVAALHDTKVSGEDLFSKIKDCTTAEFQPPKRLFEMALQREVTLWICDLMI